MAEQAQGEPLFKQEGMEISYLGVGETPNILDLQEGMEIPYLVSSSSAGDHDTNAGVRAHSGHDRRHFARVDEHQYPFYTTIKSRGGHIIDLNDTSGHETITIKHGYNGSTIQIKSNGEVIITSSSRLEQIDKDYSLNAKDAKMSFGNLTLKVEGNLNLEVGGEFNISAQTKNESIQGVSTEVVQDNKISTVTGNNVSTVKGNDVKTTLTGQHNIVKGTKVETVDGGSIISAKSIDMTSPGSIDIASNAFSTTSVTANILAGEGSIGGEGVTLLADTLDANAVWGNTVDGTTITGATINSAAPTDPNKSKLTTSQAKEVVGETLE